MPFGLKREDGMKMKDLAPDGVLSISLDSSHSLDDDKAP